VGIRERDYLSTEKGKLMDRDDVILKNMIDLADHHRKHCEGESCNISLSFLLELLGRAGIWTSDEQKRHFL